VPEQLDGALAPRPADSQGTVEIAGGVEMLEDVDEDLGREESDGAFVGRWMGKGGDAGRLG
jgi:hypothetical protein